MIECGIVEALSIKRPIYSKTNNLRDVMQKNNLDSHYIQYELEAKQLGFQYKQIDTGMGWIYEGKQFAS